ncbi:glycoside hydrolase family 3 N-terminal domain-containing protein [Glaciimonas sp. PCH181]|uniref:glycoside hydrolase family 3 N-terminal domain-containing protein n=1 Tax=Glaciimonas sp. PCH181 TaxID=2133943 RepID=UPI000D3968A8|nr:glycoside hydrolase family 3 N-terminal domain-containing protein [Glaciimonas sp. PCH181]PUA18435.1 glycoside hydrolase [Glaciimonas sp. PCH181]
MSNDLHRDAYAVLLPAFAGLNLDDPTLRFLDSGGVSVLLGESRSEYVARKMSAERSTSETAQQFRQLVDEVTARIGCPPLVAVDHELGGIERLHRLVPALPTTEQAHRLNALEIERHCHLTAAAAREIGVNLFLAPIVDVVTGINPWLHNRNLGPEASEVSRIACAYVRGIQTAGVVATAKHFPGHHITENDPALLEAHVPGTRHDLEAGLSVFKDVIASGVKAVMAGPALVPAIDALESSSTSKNVINLLRNDLGFSGLIISDDLDAPSILRGKRIEDTAVASLVAGSHLLLVSSEAGLDSIVAAIVRAVETGVLSQEHLTNAAKKVRALAREFHAKSSVPR